jgi:hypothetical protein
MKRITVLFAIAAICVAGLAAAAGDRDFTGQRVPLGIFVTQWNCPPCALANQVLDAYIPTQGNDVAIIRVHGWWPGPNNDPIYWANPEQADFLIYNTPGDDLYAPRLWLDNYLDIGAASGLYEQAYEDQKLVPSPLEIAVSYDEPTSQVTVVVDVLDEMPAGDYRLYVAITEDGVQALGGNGERFHNQAFRYLYPDVDGIAITTEIGEQTFTVATLLDEEWVFDNLRATAYVQEYASAVIQNCGTMFLHDSGVSDVPTDRPVLATQLIGAHPNPFNPQTVIAFSLDRAQRVKLSIHDLNGRHVVDLVDGIYAAGRHPITWDGRDAAGREVASGGYVIRLESEDGVQADKLTLVR